ncbi:phosphatase PAP2 family protein [Longispora albida]|uniref:phosphatase PAP2 family protein n=1 Tax=Longispora albida TaxID=203523 RepID=UPI0003784946|nr:phosphatase PAP2 family protein [Longispora albida]
MTSERAARLVTEILAPAVLAAVMPLAVGLHAGPTLLAGLGWGLLTLLFSCVVPYGVIRLFMATGRITSGHHMGAVEERRGPLVWGVLSVVAGVGVLIWLGAPRQTLAMAYVMLAVLASAGAVNALLRWKLSGHASVAAGSAAVAVALFGPVLLVSLPMVALVGWSRVRLKDHTVAQVVAGTLLGGAVAGAVWLTST